MKTISTYYTSLVFALLALISGCSTIVEPDTGKNNDISNNVRQVSKSEIQDYRHAITELNNNNLDKAETLLLDFVKNRPELAGPWANLGLLYIKKRQYKKAEGMLNNALEQNSKLPQAHNLLGVIENQRGNIRNAEEYFTSAIQYKEKYAIAHYNLALLYDIYLQDVNKAIRHYSRYLELVKNGDKRTADWLEQLRNSVKKG